MVRKPTTRDLCRIGTGRRMYFLTEKRDVVEKTTSRDSVTTLIGSTEEVESDVVY